MCLKRRILPKESWELWFPTQRTTTPSTLNKLHSPGFFGGSHLLYMYSMDLLLQTTGPQSAGYIAHDSFSLSRHSQRYALWGRRRGPSQWLLPDFGTPTLEKPDWLLPCCPSACRHLIILVNLL
ncbi:Hypothetical predicted protein [Podarcis lilfordi]|uniref:Uncharacterized protein n=1 Tax=Podarcis lilfordi TaxID=74358 RepID=A0AA35PRL5_9SAUR|nr:Hypothetical predicted protein [Podarcis lilfordi]